MIRATDFMTDLDDRFDAVKQTLYEMMTDYNSSPAEVRDPFTEVLFRLLEGMGIWKFNKFGSFLELAAKKVIEEETNPKPGYMKFSFHVVGRFERLERGEVNFQRSWDTWLEDAVREKDRTDYMREHYGMSYNDIMILKKGPPPKTAARPYVGWAMEDNATPFAAQLADTIASRLTASGRRWR
jgi:hypothetical protein